MRILVVEDEHRIASSIKKGLELEKHAVDVAYDGTEGFDLASSEKYNLIILDLMLPGMDGLTICRQLRAEKNHTPILILTAKGQVEDKVLGLDTGADDYLTKPFSFEELLARIRAISRRPNQTADEILVHQDISLNLNQLQAYKNKKPINLSSKEYMILEMFLRSPQKILNKDQIINHVWNYESDVLPNTVEAHIKKLRQKIGQNTILTIRGFGYKLSNDV